LADELAFMKKIYSFFIFLSFILQINAQQQYRIVTVGFYNLENFFDTINDPNKNDEDFTPNGALGYNKEVFTDKVSKLSDVLSLISTDQTPEGLSLIGVAEVENRSVLESLVASPKLKDRNYQIVHYDSPDLRGIDVGFLYNPKYFKVKHSEPLNVKLAGDEGKGFFTRDVLFIEGVFMGDPTFVFVNHWPSRRGGEEASAPARFAAAKVVKHKVDSLIAIDPNYKIFIMGDFNDEPVSPSIASVLGAKGYVKDLKQGDIYNPWVEFYKKGIGSSAFNDSWGLFDQVMMSTGNLKEYTNNYYFHKAVIFKRDFMIQKTGRYKNYPKRTFDSNRYAGGYSDHFPTYLIFVKPVN
jgi:predicted extracellular nuclease